MLTICDTTNITNMLMREKKLRLKHGWAFGGVMVLDMKRVLTVD